MVRTDMFGDLGNSEFLPLQFIYIHHLFGYLIDMVLRGFIVVNIVGARHLVSG